MKRRIGQAAVPEVAGAFVVVDGFESDEEPDDEPAEEPESDDEDELAAASPDEPLVEVPDERLSLR